MKVNLNIIKNINHLHFQQLQLEKNANVSTFAKFEVFRIKEKRKFERHLTLSLTVLPLMK